MTTREAQAYCTRLTKESGSSFYYSFLFLPRERREAMYALYAFCRDVDSAVDDPRPGSDPQAYLARWRSALAIVYTNSPPPAGEDFSPVLICLAHHIRRFDLPRVYFEEIIAGVEMDLTATRYATFEDLYTYCYRVASVVGLICLRIFGARAAESETYAVNLGLAFQLTNILRDVGADAARGRIYLPLEDLARFAVYEHEILAGRYNDAFSRLMDFECGRARAYYDRAEKALPESDRRALVPAEIMRAIYRTILGRIEASGHQIFSGHITLSAGHRLAIALRAWMAAYLKGAGRPART